jgi:Tol biopolymer transport system component
MKRCPECRRDYDDTLSFCLEDGTELVYGVPAEHRAADEPVTAILSSAGPASDAATSIRSAPIPGGALNEEDSARGIQSRRARTFLTIAAIAVLIGAVAFGVYRYSFQSDPVAEHFKNVKLTRVTAEGGVESATISPDGKYIAYSLEESGNRSLWTKHLATESRVQIVPPTESISMYASAFSPDGGYVYFTRQDDQHPKGALYSVPVLGGTPRKIVTDVSQPVAVSRDGKQIVFGRYKLTNTDDQLLTIDATGANERLVATISEPEYLQGSSAAWSPDGKMIAFSYGTAVSDGSGPSPVYEMAVSAISLEDPVIKPITKRTWPNIGSVVWFNDGSALAFVAAESRTGAKQIWQCSFPGGQASRITNDLNSYDFDSLSITADDSSLIAVQKHPVSQIWLVPDGDYDRASMVVTRKNVQDGRYGLGWTPDGRIIYDSSAGSNSSIWSMNTDGSDARQLTDASTDDYAPEVSPDGRHVIFGAHRNGFQIWRMDVDGENPKQITFGTGSPTYSYSPDGRWVVYNPYLGGILKMPSDGGEPVTIVAHGALIYPQVSPDGDLLAYILSDKETKRPKIHVIRFDNGAFVKDFDLPVSTVTDYFESLSNRGFHWSPDGKGIVYIDTIRGVSNLWLQPLEGNPARQITRFKSDRIYRFAYARDGRTLALSRGSDTPDAVLITDIK